jgi:hypothetical protein
MRTAILITGNIRNWLLNKENFIQTFQPYNPDIFISTYNLQYGYHPALQHQYNDYEDFVIGADEVINHFSGLNVVDIVVEDFNMVENFMQQENDKFHPMLRGLHGNSFGQYRKLKMCIDMIKANEIKGGFKYDRIIKTRCDIKYIDSPDLSIESDNLVYDQGSNPENEYGSDHFFMGSRETMFKLSDFTYNEFYTPVYDDSQCHPPHGFIRNAIRYHNLKRSPRHIIKYLLRKNGFEQTI